MKKDVRIPAQGLPKSEILAAMKAMKGDDADWKSGRVWSLVYHGGDRHEKLLKEAYNLFISENFLNPMAFRSLKRMEAEVVAMTANMLHGEERAVGAMTSGGTESIIMAVKACRDRARSKKPWILRPEMVVPKSIHVAFEKAAHYLGVKFVSVPLRDDFRVDIGAMKRRISHSTVMLAASAPQFPQGVIDPIEEIGRLALKKKIPFHVDSCIGGFLLPWLEQLGRPVPLFDFRVPGVTSISADVHKYGYASKGASVILYRDMGYLRHQFFISTNWPGGIYASASMPGTRPGGAIAAAWAAMRYMGRDGYLRMAKKTARATSKLLDGIGSIEEMKILGEPDMSLVAYASKDKNVDIYAVADQLEKKGWLVDRQQHPASIHVTVTSNHAGVIDTYLSDLSEAVAHVKANPDLAYEGNAAMYGMMAKLPIRGMVKLAVRKVMEGMYSPEGQVPDLGNLGSDEDDDPLLKLVDRYGSTALKLLGQVEEAGLDLKEKIESALGRLVGRS